MNNDDDWLNFHFASRDIEGNLGVSAGEAQAMLRQACASPGRIRSRKQPYIVVGREAECQGPTERIEPSEWRNREIDLMTDNDGCRYFVDVRESDFRYWLDNQQKTKLTKTKPKPRAKKKRDLAELAVKTIWPDAGQGGLTNSEIVQQVGEWITAYLGRKHDISLETILRAAGRKA
jgi:hypothetical protein